LPPALLVSAAIRYSPFAGLSLSGTGEKRIAVKLFGLPHNIAEICPFGKIFHLCQK
jgi:hypothetical protein